MALKEEKSLYTERADGRPLDALRPIHAEIGVVPNADGSAMYQSGDTIAIAAVYGPKKMHPQHQQDPARGYKGSANGIFDDNRRRGHE